MAGPSAVSPAGKVPGMTPTTPGAATAAIAPPAILGLNSAEDSTAPFKDGEYTDNKRQQTIEEGIKSLAWAVQELGGEAATPKSKKKTEMFTKAFRASSVELNKYATGLEGVIKSLEPQKSKQKLGPTLDVLKQQLILLRTLEKTHTLLASEKGNQSVKSALSSAKGAVMVDASLKIMQSPGDPDDRNHAFGILDELKAVPAGIIQKKVDKLKPTIAKQEEFLRSPGIQAITNAAKARVAMGNQQAA